MSYRPLIRTPVQIVHERLLGQLPVRTVAARPVIEDEPFAGGQTGNPGKDPFVAARRAQIIEMLLARISTRTVAAAVQVSRVTVQKYKRALKKRKLI